MGFLDRFRGKEGYDRMREERQDSASNDSDNEIYRARLKRAAQTSDTYKRNFKKIEAGPTEIDINKLEFVGTGYDKSPITGSLYADQQSRTRKLKDAAREVELARKEKAIFDTEESQLDYNQRMREHIEKKHYDIEKEVEKQRRIDREKFNIRIMDAKLKQEEAFSREYGPAFNLPVVGQAVGKISQFRNYQQIQDIKRLKLETARQIQQGQLQRYQRENQQMTAPASGGFGQPLSLGGGFGMGMGMTFGPPRESGYGGGSFGMDSPSRDPLSLPIIGGLGGGFGQRREEPVQQVPQQQYVPQAQPARVQYAPRPQPRTSDVVPGSKDTKSVYRKIMSSYGPRFVVADPVTIQEGEPLYSRAVSRRGNRIFLLIK